MDLPTTHYDNQPIAKDSPKPSKFFKIYSYIFLIGVFLAPLFFIPSSYAPLDIVKTIFLSSFILISCILYVLGMMGKKTISIPNHAVGYSGIAVVISVLISTFLSSNISKSFMGQGFEVGTASFLLLIFLVTFFVSRIASKDKKMILNIYVAIFLSFVVLAIFHIFRFTGLASSMNFGGLLTDITSSIIGKWNDFGIMAASVGLLSFFGIKFFSHEKSLKRVFIVSLIVCGAFLFIINSVLIWGALAFIVLAVLIYEFRTNPMKDKFISRLSYLSLIVLVISIALAWKGNVISTPINNALKIGQVETVLPWQLTLDVTSDTLKESPFFGAGPNRFVYQFLRYKPLGINQTLFWNAEFTSGFGTIPTFLVTQGIVGAILWCLFFVFLVRDGIRVLKRTADPFKKFIVTTSFFITCFLWIINLIYVPSHVSIFLTFLFTGLFIASLYGEGVISDKEYGAMAGSKVRRFAPALYVVVIIVLVVWLGAYVKKTVALAYFQKGIKELNTSKSADAAQALFQKALKWDASDIYYQALSEINIIKIGTLVQDSTPPDQQKIQLVGALIDDAVANTKKAIAVDPTNYYNYISQARISELGSSLNIDKAYENAKSAYVSALKYNPYSPSIYLSLARLEASKNNVADAEQDIGKALQLKQNYIEAIFFLSQLQVNNGQIADAIISAKVATQINPSDPILFFQLGLLQYNDKNYSEAVDALAKAVNLNGQYANARYFLGLSYARLGKNEDAIKQFTELAKTNPDNTEVAFILSNIQEGKSPFTDVKPPIDSKPEKRKDLPLTEKTLEKNTSDNGSSTATSSSKKKTVK